MRRFISSLLAVLVIVLSCFPCNDAQGSACASGGAAQTLCKAANDENCPLHSEDGCSPFCTCSCCAGITLPVSLALQAPPLFSYTEKRSTRYVPQRAEGVTVPVWQPPRLV